MIKLKDLLEQTEKYKSHTIASTFDANRIVPNATWKRDLNPVINNIKAFQREGYRLNQIKVIIKSGASLANATNRYEDEKNPTALHPLAKIAKFSTDLFVLYL